MSRLGSLIDKQIVLHDRNGETYKGILTYQTWHGYILKCGGGFNIEIIWYNVKKIDGSEIWLIPYETNNINK